MFENFCRDFFSWQYLILLFGVIAIVLAMYPGGLKMEFEDNLITSNKIKDCWHAEWFLQNTVISLVYTALTGLVILNQVRDLESNIFHFLKISGLCTSAYYLANLTISVGRYLVLHLPILLLKLFIYGKSDWHWYPFYDLDPKKEKIVLDCSACM